MAGAVECPNGRCKIEGGSFQLGSTDGNAEERPAKIVTMSAFYLDETGVTQDQFKKFLASPANAERRWTMPDFEENQKGGNFPVVGVPLEGAKAYCQAQGGYVPTAAQIEFALELAVRTTPAILSPRGFINEPAPFQPVCGQDGRDVDSLGLCGLMGHLWEQTSDAYDPNFYSRAAHKDPSNPLTDPYTQFQEFRGGGGETPKKEARPSVRAVFTSLAPSPYVGLRCAYDSHEIS